MKTKLKSIITLMLVLALATSIMGCAVSQEKETTLLPNVMGINYEDAKVVLENAGFTVTAIETDPNSILPHTIWADEIKYREIKKGEIFKVNDETMPDYKDERYSPIAPDGNVTIYYAKEDYPIEPEGVILVPNVMGVNYEEAIAILEKAGLTVDAVETDASSIISISYDDRAVSKGDVFKINDEIYATFSDSKFNPMAPDKKVTIYYAKDDYIPEEREEDISDEPTESNSDISVSNGDNELIGEWERIEKTDNMDGRDVNALTATVSFIFYEDEKCEIITHIEQAGNKLTITTIDRGTYNTEGNVLHLQRVDSKTVNDHGDVLEEDKISSKEKFTYAIEGNTLTLVGSKTQIYTKK